MAYELKFNIRQEGQQELERLAQIVEAVGRSGQLSGVKLFVFQESLKANLSVGQSLEQALRSISRAYNRLDPDVIRVTRGVLEQETAMKRAAAAATAGEVSLARLAGAVRQLSSAPTTGLARLSEMFAGLAVPVGVGGAVAVGVHELQRFLAETANTAREQLRLAQATGFSIEQVSALAGASRIAGGSVETLIMAMRHLSEGLSQNSDEGKRARAALQELGIQTTDLAGKTRPAEALLLDISAALRLIPDPLERIRLATDLFSRSGSQLLPLLNRDLRELMEQARATGAVFSDEGARQADVYAEAVTKLHLRLTALARTLAQPFLLTFAEIIDPRAMQRAEAIHQGPGRMLVPAPGAPFGFRAQPAGASPAERIVGDLMARQRLEDAQRAIELFRRETDQESYLRDKMKEYVAAQEQALAKFARTADQADLAAAKSAAGRVRSIQAQLEATKALEQGEQRLAELRQRLEAQAAPPEARPFVQAAQRVAQFPAALQPRAAEAETNLIRLQAVQAAQAEMQKRAIALETVKTLEEEDRRRSEQQIKDAKQAGKAIEQDLRDAELTLNTLTQAWLDDADRNARRLVASIRAAAVPGEEIDVIEREYQVLLDLARQRFDIQQRQDLDEVSLLQLRERYTKEIDDLAEQREEQLQELRKRNLEEYRRLAGGLFDALLSGPRGIRQFFLSQARGLGSQIFANLAGPIVQRGVEAVAGAVPETRDAAGRLSGLAGILRGTIFDVTHRPGAGLEAALDATARAVRVLPVGIAGGVLAIAGGPETPNVPGLAPGAIPESVTASLSRIQTAVSTGAIGIADATQQVPYSSAPLPTSLPDAATQEASEAVKQGVRALSQIFTGTAAGAGAVLTGGLPAALQTIFGSGESIQTGPGRAIARAEGIQGIGQRVGAGIALGGTLAAGTEGVISGIRIGGVRGTSQAVSSAALTAAALDPEPISKAVLAAVGGLSGLVHAFLGDPRQNYANAVARAMEEQRFLAPPPINYQVDQFGNLTNIDRFGNIRSIGPAQYVPPDFIMPYTYHGQYIPPTYSGPGTFRPTGQAGPPVPFNTAFGPPAASAAPVVNVVIQNVHAWDSKSFSENAGKIAEAVRKAMQDNHPFTTELRRTVLGH